MSTLNMALLSIALTVAHMEVHKQTHAEDSLIRWPCSTSVFVWGGVSGKAASFWNPKLEGPICSSPNTLQKGQPSPNTTQLPSTED